MAPPSAELSLDKIRTALVGMELSHVWQGHSTALFLEFGKLSERRRHKGTIGNPVGEISIGLEFGWRIESGFLVLCGSEGNREKRATEFAELLGRAALSLEWVGRIPELQLVLSGGVRILTFSAYEDGPEWTVTDHREQPPVWCYWKAGEWRADDGNQLA